MKERKTIFGALGGLCLAFSGHAVATTTTTTVFPDIPTPIPCEGKTPKELLSQGYVVIQKDDAHGAKEKDAGFVAITEDTLLPFIMEEDASPDKPIYDHVATKKRYTDLCVWKRVHDHPTHNTPDSDIIFYTYFGKPVK